MTVLLAVAHIAGAVIVLFAFGAGVLVLAGWESERNRKSALDEISIALGIPPDEVASKEYESKVVQFVAARFSSELLRNRFSDLCGWIQTGWGWLGTLVQVGVLCAVIWYTSTDGPSNAVHAWWIVGIAFSFWIASVVFAFACKLLTGRFPGQARQARKLLAEGVRNQRSIEPNDEE